MKSLLFAAALSLAPCVMAAAEQPVGPSDFRAYAEGYTLYFERDGEHFGAESFEPGGLVVWQYRDGSCVSGVWRPYGAQLCFKYETSNEVLCWRMLRDPDGGLRARLLGDAENAGMEIQITRRDKEPLLCANSGTNT